jgi:Ca-activated chloride channel homolog
MHNYFANPWFLLLLPIVPFIVWRWLQRPRTALRFSDTGLLATLPPGRGHRAHRLGILLRAAALLCLVLGLAGPRWPDRSTRIPTEGVAIMMVVDNSGSMATADFDWPGEQRISRIEAVKRAFELFVKGGDGPEGEHLDGRPDDLIGLTPFATRPGMDECPLTLSHSVLLNLIREMQPVADNPDEMRTNVSDAIILALTRLRGETAPRKVMILLSDGEDNVRDTASKATYRQAAQLAANFNIPIYAIDAGGPLGDGLEAGSTESAIQREGGIRTLQEVAKITQGQYFTARDTRALIDVCRRIDGLERQEIQSYQYRRYYDAFQWLGLASFVLWMTVTVLELTYWQRIP